MFLNIFRKKKTDTLNNSRGSEKQTKKQSRTRRSINKEELRSMVNEGEIFNEQTYHKTTKEGVELKYCTWCKEWKPLSGFNRHKGTRDNFASRCRECEHKQAEVLKAGKSLQSEASNTPETQTTNEDINTHAFDMISGMQEILKQLEEEIVNIMLKLETLTNEQKNKVEDNAPKSNNLTEQSVVNYINTHSLAPRVFFNAIAKYDKRYTFYCKDNATGLTSPIKTEIEA